MTVNDVLSDLAFVVSQDSTNVKAIYDRAASRYEHFRDLWLCFAGGQAERAMLTMVRESICPGWRILDAGAGTGVLSRHVKSIEPTADICMLDFSEQMLRLAPETDGERVLGSVLELPFPDHFIRHGGE